MTTDSSSSFTQSSKTPVAIRNEVVITIEDDDDGEVIYKSEKTRTEHGVIGFATVGNADKNGAAWVMNDSCNGRSFFYVFTANRINMFQNDTKLKQLLIRSYSMPFVERSLTIL